LKQERPEMYELKEERNEIVIEKYLKGTILGKILNGYPLQNFIKYFAYSIISKHSKHFFIL